MREFLIYTFLILTITSCNSASEIDVSVMTYNVRYGLANDGENSWESRKDNLINVIKSKHPDFLGTQEGLPFQVNFIKTSMPNYEFIGTDRDGNGKGENTAIFYNKTKFEVLENHTFWLAKNQEIPNKDWDAAFPRIYTYGLFEHIESKHKIWIVNTHFDHVGVLARENSAKIIIEKINEINTENYPLIFMGDLNAEPESKPVLNLKSQLKDSKEVSINKPSGPKGTFNSFQFETPVTRRIDYIFISNNNKIKVNNYAVLSDSNDSKYPSDHLPVYVELIVNTN